MTMRNRPAPLEFLVLTPTPTHPQNFGNRKRIYSLCRRLQTLNVRIHLLHYPAESDWRDSIPERSRMDMERCWDSQYIVAPTRKLHTPSVAVDHKLDEWWDPAIGDYLSWLFSRKHFDAIVVNYIWLSKAFDFVPNGVVRILDTHDRFSDRRAMLAAEGLGPEFFHISQEDEAKGLNRADIIWAIKDDEGRFFSTLTERTIVTVAHADETRPVTRIQHSGDSEYLTLGFLGASNTINRQNVRSFLKVAIPLFRRYLAPIRLKIGGSVCDLLGELRGEPGVALTGKLDDVRKFYADIDAAIIPMGFGTGLKIKTAEALAASIPIIANSHAFEGFDAKHPWHMLATHEALAEACIELAFQRELLDDLRHASVDAQLAILDKVSRSIQSSVELVRHKIPKLIIVLPREAMTPNSALAILLEHSARYLAKSYSVIFYCDFCCSEETLERANAKFSSLGRVFARPDPDGRMPDVTDSISLPELLASVTCEGLWLLSSSAELQELSRLPTRLPIFLSLDAMRLLRRSPVEVRQQLPDTGELTLVGSNRRELAAASSYLGATACMHVPYLYWVPFFVAHWMDDDFNDGFAREIWILSSNPASLLLRSTISVLSVMAGFDMSLRIIHCGDDVEPVRTGREGRDASVRWVKITDIDRNLASLGQRPRFVVVLDPDEPAFGYIQELCCRTDVPLCSVKRAIAQGTESSEPCSSWLGFMRSLSHCLAQSTARHGIRNRKAQRQWAFGNNAGWSSIGSSRRLIETSGAD